MTRRLYAGRVFIRQPQFDKAAAKDHYLKFLAGMTAADPGLPEVADAQKRLAALK